MADGDVTLRAVFPEWEREVTFLDFQELLQGLESLIWTSLHSSVEHENERMHLKVINRVVADQVIRRVRYNSPLEVVFTISASTGALAGAGFTLLRLWDKFQESRVKTAEAGTVVSAFDLVRETMQLERIGSQESHQMREAARTLEMLDRLEAIEGSGEPQPG